MGSGQKLPGMCFGWEFFRSPTDLVTGKPGWAVKVVMCTRKKSTDDSDAHKDMKTAFPKQSPGDR